MPKKLSKSGKTKFEVDNLDHLILLQSIEHFKEHISVVTFPENYIMTKGFVLDRLESLQETFKVGE